MSFISWLIHLREGKIMNEKKEMMVEFGDEVEVNIKFKADKAQMDNIYKAIEYLGKAGITFDTGGCKGEDGKIDYDWEFDWSLKGANVFFRRIAKKKEINE